MPIGFVNHAAAMCEKAYLLWGGSREDYENMMIWMGWHILPWFYEMEPFVRICHGHFPLKQYTNNNIAEPHLMAINLHGLMTGKWTMSLFYIRGGNEFQTMSEGKRGGSKRAWTDVVLCLTSNACLCSIKNRKREIPFTVTIILVNGPWVTTYCGPTPSPPLPPKKKKNLISLKMKAILKAPELGHCHQSVMYCLHLIKNLTPFHC